jgi:hypothetical protein
VCAGSRGQSKQKQQSFRQMLVEKKALAAKPKNIQKNSSVRSLYNQAVVSMSTERTKKPVTKQTDLKGILNGIVQVGGKNVNNVKAQIMHTKSTQKTDQPTLARNVTSKQLVSKDPQFSFKSYDHQPVRTKRTIS